MRYWLELRLRRDLTPQAVDLSGAPEVGKTTPAQCLLPAQ